MARYGFGNRGFGATPFGESDWCKIVLYDELPDEVRQLDVDTGGPYLRFVQSMCPSFTWLKRHLDRFRYITNPRQIREDLLLYLGENFGINVDLAEPLEYQRMRVGLAAQWNIVKGTLDSYVVLCRVHGFECDVISLWWDGFAYSETGPQVYGEASTVSTVSGPTETTFTIRLKCAPVEPGTLKIQVASGGVLVISDDALGGWVGYSGSIDYGWGYATLVIPASGATYINSSYESVAGGCECVKCKTHRIRLRITPGDIGGQSELTISEAFQRLYDKLGLVSGDGVIPIHVELEQRLIAGVGVLSIGYRYDILEADAYVADRGLRWLVVP